MFHLRHELSTSLQSRTSESIYIFKKAVKLILVKKHLVSKYFSITNAVIFRSLIVIISNFNLIKIFTFNTFTYTSIHRRVLCNIEANYDLHPYLMLDKAALIKHASWC